MFSRIFQKFKRQPQESVTSADFNPRVAAHYGIPATASIIALDPVQSLLAVGTLDGRIKVIGGDNIEALLISPKQSSFKNLQFLQNQGFLASVSSDNEIQVWDLESRQIASTLQWESNITAFSVIYGTSYMYIGCEHGIVSVLKFDAEDKNINLRPYYIPTNVIADTAGVSLPDHLPVVGVLHQPCSPGNRMLIAYENGLLVLWDASEDQVVLIRGYKDLQLKDAAVVDSVKGTKHEHCDDLSGHKLMEKDISSLCWASDNGTVLAVGYVDGDIMFWDLSNTSLKDQLAANLPNNVVKLELSSGSKKLPVIVLHWSASRSTSHQRGQLYVYGGDQIGSEEVVTILSINWSSGIESLKCISRVDLTLNGSFTDMVLLPSAGTMEKSGDFLFILTSPGQLHTYDHYCLSALMSQQKKIPSVPAVQYLPIIPTTKPNMTAAKLGLVHKNGEFSRALSEMVLSKKLNVAHSPKGGKSWPLSGGVPGQPFDVKNYQVERVYIAGYQDGSVRMWDATYPVLMLVYTIEPPVLQVNDIALSSTSVSVLALDFCSITLRLAIGNQSGLVRLYNLTERTDEKSLHFITETQNEVHSLQQEDDPRCIAMFSIANSSVCTLQFAHSGARLAVGFESGKVTLVDLKTLSILFVIDGISDSSSPVTSLVVKSFSEGTSLISGPEDSQSNVLNDPEREVVIMMTRNAHIVVRDGTTENSVTAQSFLSKMDSTAISMHMIEGSDFISEVHNEKHPSNSPRNNEAKDEPRQPNPPSGSTQAEPEMDKSNKNAYFGQSLKSFFILLCCEDALYLYSLNSVIEGDNSSIHKINFTKPCCWTTMFKKDEDCGVIVLYSTGDIEMRSLPSFKVVGESSLMSILRWNFKTDMDKTICSSNDGQIILVNGCELAFVSLLAYENNFRIPESLPSLYDQVLSAAADSTYNLSPSQKQAATPGIFGGIIKGLKAVTGEQNIEVFKLDGTHLESLFSHPPFLKPSTSVKDNQQDVELKIDDIKLNEPLIVSSSSDSKRKETKDEGTEREKLFDGATDSKPKMRTAEEIKAKYRKTGDASAAAAMAKDKLIERQEKLEKLRENTEELQNGAEDFASMAKEIAKRMENRKWWQI